MGPARKVKVSVTLDADVLGTVDRLAASEGATRSAIVQRWLRQISKRALLVELEKETAAYYDALSVAERADDAAWAASASQAARSLQLDEGPERPSARRAPSRRR
jgi:metal-responsive CopG/Arc/MetJ family transcriptional regulator